MAREGGRERLRELAEGARFRVRPYEPERKDFR